MMSSLSAVTRDADGKPRGLPTPGVIVAYSVFAVAALWMYHALAEQSISSILTMSVMLQCLSFVLLGLKINNTKSAAGISARTLAMDALSLGCRLSSTVWLNGYLPTDASGDYLYQMADFGSLCMVGYLLHQVLVVRKATYQVGADYFNAGGLVLGAVVAAALFHPSMNHRPVFDTIWTLGLFVDAVAMVPQLWLIMKTGGTVEAMTGHHIFTMAASRLLSACFWYLAGEDVACDSPWIEGFNHGVWAILAAHAVHFVLLADFLYYYLKAGVSGRLSRGMPLACGEV